MKRKLTIFVFLLCMGLSTTAYGAIYTGKVIDADTKEPIEGAVVVASWLEERATPTGPTTRSKDIREALTDKNGVWVIEGPKGRDGGNITAIFTFLTGTYYTRPPEFIIFKPGYCSWPKGFGIAGCKDKIKGFDIEKKIELPKLTDRNRENLSRNIPFIAAEKDGRIPIYDSLLKQDIEEKRR
jgi:hypothetical protein